MSFQTFLGIETSCDECSASIVVREKSSLRVVSLATDTQILLHRPFGGVVPEVASRSHLEKINEIVHLALKDAGLKKSSAKEKLTAIAVTNRPGLVGALLVGVSAAKSLAYVWKKPLIPVHHLEGHVSSIFLDEPELLEKIKLPCLVAVVSGGHTNLVIMKEKPDAWKKNFLNENAVGRSRDDAAGEAFDKTAKLLGFPYPGGAWIDKMAKGGKAAAFQFPRGMIHSPDLDFSFSGLKTSVAVTVKKLTEENKLDDAIPHLCASIQEAIVDVLVSKIKKGISYFKCESVAVVGGVSANSWFRRKLTDEVNVSVYFPQLKYCTDNAAMIGAAGAIRFSQGDALTGDSLLELNALASSET